jgi:hypothetical protein
VSPVTEERVIRLTLDINVLVSDILARRNGRRGTSASMLVDAVRDGTCPAGPVQLVTSLPIINNYSSVMQRHLGYSEQAADEKAWILEQYAIEGPMPEYPHIVVGSGYVAFETEYQLRAAIEGFAASPDVAKLFNEAQDDRYVLETALAGRADIVATSDVDDFRRGQAILLEREDIVLFPFAGRTIVIAKPSFVAYWLRQGVVPDASFVAANPNDFRTRQSRIRP